MTGTSPSELAELIVRALVNYPEVNICLSYMKIVSIVGARPQFIKAAVIHRVISKFPDINEIILHTGQHFDDAMSDIFFRELEIPKPDYNLNINTLSHGSMTGRMMEGIETVLVKEKPDCVIVYGDTNTTLAGALAAKKLHQKLSHVEAGLRSYNNNMPEETNRIITDRISDYLFCPTRTAIENLDKEGFGNFACKIIFSGDVMYDAVKFYEKLSLQKSTILSTLKLKEYIISTIHRPENTDHLTRLKSIVEGLNRVHNNIPVIMPLHPRTRKILVQNKIKTNFSIINPVGYLDMLELLRNCKLVITDSGGLQKEAFFLKKNCVVLRDETEWVELKEKGYAILPKPEPGKILSAVSILMAGKFDFESNLYGRGDAGRIIIETIYKTV